MTDYFALLSEKRRPWIDTEFLKQKFLTLSAEVHPDRVHGATESQKQAAQEHFAELNAAYNCLRQPKDRLAHLIELETGSKLKQVQNVPPDLMDVFMEITNNCRGVDAFLTERNTTASHLLRLQLFERAQELTERLLVLQGKVNSWTDELSLKLKEADVVWEKQFAERTQLIESLQRYCQLLGYYGRWSAQIQERIVQLSL